MLNQKVRGDFFFFFFNLVRTAEALGAYILHTCSSRHCSHWSSCLHWTPGCSHGHPPSFCTSSPMPPYSLIFPEWARDVPGSWKPALSITNTDYSRSQRRAKYWALLGQAHLIAALLYDGNATSGTIADLPFRNLGEDSKIITIPNHKGSLRRLTATWFASFPSPTKY